MKVPAGFSSGNLLENEDGPDGPEPSEPTDDLSWGRIAGRLPPITVALF
ncbi:hypothetical protein [Agrobacterium larrymoorei]|uniref:Uncharacterized protein n=1 Tax=Agrobacterium larrymoorei TaxID=160699 RepID=A0AAF0KDL5_9HYPH|nr:hypothetical protein [Agrobacterium larrymoorei]WHA41128.1 hypothetical protein CFBP5477_000285 [Agrobacterium larrymoorei]